MNIHARRFPLTRTFLFCALLLCGLALAARSSSFPSPGKGDAPAATSAATREGRLAIFDDAWTTIRERYYDPQLNGV
ncbi:MAG TPA: hypothetical protein VM866_10455, partial [Pyrinomonadaceae bacterium]|nr:hypothetical protein [Pyrinomonadaceae bacterium]